MMVQRLNGCTRNCQGCRYWSELIAGNLHNNGGPIEALCLNSAGPMHGRYTSASGGCTTWASGHLGAVDDPHADPSRYEGATA